MNVGICFLSCECSPFRGLTSMWKTGKQLFVSFFCFFKYISFRTYSFMTYLNAKESTYDSDFVCQFHCCCCDKKKITQQKATVLFGKKMPLKENGTIRRYKVQHCWRKYVTVETGFLVPYMLYPCPVSQTISCLL